MAYRRDLQEDLEALESRINTYPAGSWGWFEDNLLIGYLISHPATSARISGLNAKIDGRKLASSDCYLIHDVAVDHQKRRRGIASALVQQALAQADEAGFSATYLVAVQDSWTFWRKEGFKEVEDLALSQEVELVQYGVDARYMCIVHA